MTNIHKQIEAFGDVIFTTMDAHQRNKRHHRKFKGSTTSMNWHMERFMFNDRTPFMDLSGNVTLAVSRK
jgi:hypothetical protein